MNLSVIYKPNTICSNCGKPIYKRPYELAAKKNLFCDRHCYFEFKRRTKIVTTCYRCGKEVIKSPSKKSERSFCSPQCHMKTLNEELNSTRMTPSTREKLREARLGTGEGKTYTKTYGRHTHRIVAEQMLGRSLKKGEVVHHIDGDKRNNAPSNLMIFKSQSEHVKYHAKVGIHHG